MSDPDKTNDEWLDERFEIELDYDDGRYDDDPSPYGGTYSEE